MTESALSLLKEGRRGGIVKVDCMRIWHLKLQRAERIMGARSLSEGDMRGKRGRDGTPIGRQNILRNEGVPCAKQQLHAVGCHSIGVFAKLRNQLLSND
jgi:hypothetical protein